MLPIVGVPSDVVHGAPKSVNEADWAVTAPARVAQAISDKIECFMSGVWKSMTGARRFYPAPSHIARDPKNRALPVGVLRAWFLKVSEDRGETAREILEAAVSAN